MPRYRSNDHRYGSWGGGANSDPMMALFPELTMDIRALNESIAMNDKLLDLEAKDLSLRAAKQGIEEREYKFSRLKTVDDLRQEHAAGFIKGAYDIDPDDPDSMEKFRELYTNLPQELLTDPGIRSMIPILTTRLEEGDRIRRAKREKALQETTRIQRLGAKIGLSEESQSLGISTVEMRTAKEVEEANNAFRRDVVAPVYVNKSATETVLSLRGTKYGEQLIASAVKNAGMTDKKELTSVDIYRALMMQANFKDAKEADYETMMDAESPMNEWLNASLAGMKEKDVEKYRLGEADKKNKNNYITMQEKSVSSLIAQWKRKLEETKNKNLQESIQKKIDSAYELARNLNSFRDEGFTKADVEAYFDSYKIGGDNSSLNTRPEKPASSSPTGFTDI